MERKERRVEKFEIRRGKRIKEKHFLFSKESAVWISQHYLTFLFEQLTFFSISYFFFMLILEFCFFFFCFITSFPYSLKTLQGIHEI